MNDIYGIDPSGDVSPVDVRNALVECFTQAHGDSLAHALNIDLSEDADDAIKRESIITFLKGVFDKIGGDFNNPNKEDLLNAIAYLKKFSVSFRDPQIIEKHVKEIMTLVDKLK